ncbi:hypothetical protein HPC49_29170 [Pyxidicoccus fallax]|uniref:Lipoprotein n=1 Tax=Pyxidicoccus fallax TaxID=394095 RepID=A0A848LJH1_9BACT|nr:hypothetical protein [Pyxidicoccus fallax]NMO17844.1 hypothetical protein [Pyxidicoccus fallax]NPC82277.1 hypothetical protein [Pyxidicoccus fallax]
MTSALRSTRRAFTLMLGSALVGGVSACGLSGTGGRAITFRMGLRTALAPGETVPGEFTTDTGWRVRLSSGLMVLGPIYLFENASPLQAQAAAPRVFQRLGEWLLPTARAHEGDFFSGGRVLGEWDREVVFDLMAGGEPRVLGRSPGIAGVARSFSLLLQPPSRALGAEGAALQGRSVVLEGAAFRQEQRVPFRVALDFPPPLELQRVDFVPIEADLDDEGLFVVEVQPHRWFEGAHFDRLTLPPGGAAVDITPETQVHRALSVNVRRHTAFAGTWQPIA